MKLFQARGNTEGKAVLNIAGMTCPSCSQHVRKALKKVKGVHDVQIRNWSDARAVVRGQGFSAEELVKQATGSGYPATLLSCTGPAVLWRSSPATRQEDTRSFDVDLAVIGTGGAGMAAVLKAAEHGTQAAIFELAEYTRPQKALKGKATAYVCQN